MFNVRSNSVETALFNRREPLGLTHRPPGSAASFKAPTSDPSYSDDRHTSMLNGASCMKALFDK